MSNQPTFLSQSVDYLGYLSQQLGDLHGIATLAHELIQNADDAKDAEGNLSATRIVFDFKDDALEVSNDAVFRPIDFERIRTVASGSKRNEAGVRTTGKFGVGFISVYQITDRPEIYSAGRHWIIMPDESESRRIAEYEDASITADQGTLFRLPWAFRASRVRTALSVQRINRKDIDAFVDTLKSSLPKAIIFLKCLNAISLLRNGEPVMQVTKEYKADEDRILIDCNGEISRWRVMVGDFSNVASKLQSVYSDIIETNRATQVRVAIPDAPIQNGLLFATLPTEQETGLPFHLDADFFPASDRKSIVFGDNVDPRTQWNRAAIRAAASVVSVNLVALRDEFSPNFSAFWAMLEQMERVHNKHQGHTRVPLGEFWHLLRSFLRKTAVVYTASGKWLMPDKTRFPRIREVQAAVSSLEALDIELVHPDLWPYQNILLRDAGVPSLLLEDICEGLTRKGLVERPQPLPPDLQMHNQLLLLRKGIHALLLRKGTAGTLKRDAGESWAKATRILQQCTLARGTGGNFWPCGSVYRADRRTHEIFRELMPKDVTFLAEPKDDPLLAILCPQFDAERAIVLLERQHEEILQKHLRNGRVRPSDLFLWFDENKSQLRASSELRQRLARLPIFPSSDGHLQALDNLYLPGGFAAPEGVARLVDIDQLRDLSDFLQFLGADRLGFEDYARKYVPQAFSNIQTSLDVKRMLLDLLTQRLGEIRMHADIQLQLRASNIVECANEQFMKPEEVYFPGETAQRIFGGSRCYAYLPPEVEGRADLYRWLGVASRPRPRDVQRFIRELTAGVPDACGRANVRRILENLGKIWSDLSDSEKVQYTFLKKEAWLLAEDVSQWLEPSQLHAAYNKSLFESQARFLDLPVNVQRQVSIFLTDLGVQPSPLPIQVVRHLRVCIQKNQEPPKDLYRWLDTNAHPEVLQELRDIPCLRIEGQYRRPNQVFWGQHNFGRFRTQLGTSFQAFRNLLAALAIQESPTYEDAFQVLKDIASELGSIPLEPEDEDVVSQCWRMLAEALQSDDELDAETMANQLQDVPCILNDQKILNRPSEMYFEDRPRFAAKFDIIKHNVIPRQERIQIALEAAGVKPLSVLIQGRVTHENVYEDDNMRKRIADRIDLIRAITDEVATVENSMAADTLCFLRADKLMVKWQLRAFRRTETSQPESTFAYLERSERALYFTSQNGNPPWSAIARELALAMVPGEKLQTVSPGLKTVLEGRTVQDAMMQLEELGISLPEKQREVASLGSRALAFDEDDSPSLETPSSEKDAFPAKGTARRTPHVPPQAERVTRVDTPATTSEQSEPTKPFAQILFESQTAAPDEAPDKPLMLPPGGPKTLDSAKQHRRRSEQLGTQEPSVARIVSASERGPQGKKLADEFRDMVHGDYGKRCQICGTTFRQRNNHLQVYVVHLIAPSQDPRTNYFGNLLGLCGWHCALIQFGEWALLDSETGQPCRDWERMRNIVRSASERIDDAGNPYCAVPIQFANVYLDWNSAPVTQTSEIRYSRPHWQYFCERLNT